MDGQHETQTGLQAMEDAGVVGLMVFDVDDILADPIFA